MKPGRARARPYPVFLTKSSLPMTEVAPARRTSFGKNSLGRDGFPAHDEVQPLIATPARGTRGANGYFFWTTIAYQSPAGLKVALPVSTAFRNIPCSKDEPSVGQIRELVPTTSLR